MNNNKKIIFTIIFLFLISAVYLSWTETRQFDPNLNKNWWVLSFSDPKSDNLSFTIENHSAKNNFHWEVISGSDKIKEGDMNMDKGSINDIDLSSINNSSGKISVDVTRGSDMKEIYKIR